MDLKEQIIHLCQLYGIKLVREKGQNFIINEDIYSKEMELAELSKDDIVLDIGAGFGFLTEKIVEIAKKVYAIEIDEKISKVFSDRLKKYLNEGRIELIIEDALKVQFPKDITKIVSNPPFSISSPLIIKIVRELYSSKKFNKGVLIFQKEFVQKLLSKPCSKNWSRLTAIFNYYMKGEFGGIVSRKNFFPRPEVDSAFLVFEIKQNIDKTHIEVEKFEKITELIFKGPNKKIKKVLKSYLKPKTVAWRIILNNIGSEVNLEKRVRCVDLSDLEKIGKMLIENEIVT